MVEKSKFLRAVRYLLLVAGLWTIPISKKPIINKLYNVYTWLWFISIAMFQLSTIAEFIRTVIDKEGFEKALMSFAMSVNASKIVIRVIIYRYYDVLSLMQEIIAKEKTIQQSKDTEILRIYSAYVTYCDRITKSLLGFTAFVILFFLYIGVNQFLKNNAIHMALNESLEAPSIYPFYFKNPEQHLTTVLAINGVIASILTPYNPGSMMIILSYLIYSAMQLKILNIQLSKIHSIAEEEYNGNVTATLKIFIKEHQIIIHFFNNLNNSCKYIILMEFCLSSLDCAGVAAQLIQIKQMDIADVLFLVCYCALLVYQIFTLSWIANNVKYQSSRMSGALFKCEWYTFNKEAKQLFCIMMTRAQEPLFITIGPFGPMTTQTFLMIIKGAYSYITIMTKN